jgi:hypothetical protein
MGFLRVSSNVEGAAIYLDDAKKQKQAWGTTPFAELIPAGPHQVLVEAPGYEPVLSRVDVERGQHKELEVKLVRLAYGVLRIDSDAAEMAVQVDGKPAGVWRASEPPLEVKVPAGVHRLVVTSTGRKTFQGSIDVPKGQALPVHVTLIPKYPRGAAWTQAVIGGVFLGTAIFFGVESNRLHGELEDDRSSGVLENDDDRITRGRLFAIGADAGFAIAGVLGALATYNFLKDPYPDSAAATDAPREFTAPNEKRARAAKPARPKKPATSRSFDLAPSLGTNAAGVVLGGHF